MNISVAIWVWLICPVRCFQSVSRVQDSSLSPPPPAPFGSFDASFHINLVLIKTHAIQQADVNSSCSFGMQPKVFIAPHTTEDVKVRPSSVASFFCQNASQFNPLINCEFPF